MIFIYPAHDLELYGARRFFDEECSMSLRTRVVLFFVPVLFSCAVTVAPTAAQVGPQATPVTVAYPLPKRITQWDEYSGRFLAVETVEVRPRVSGFIDTVHFRDGQIVKAGDLLFTIDKRPFEIALEGAKAEVTRAKAQVALAELEVERATPLVRSGAVTQRDFDQRRANLNVAIATLQAAEASAKAAELNLEWTEVRAPISGPVSDRKVDVGNLVTGGQAGATLLTTIVSVDPIHFVFDVSEADFLRYARLFLKGERSSATAVSTPVRIKLADESDWARTGRMNFLDNQLNPRSGTLRARAIVDNTDHMLQPGVFGRLQLFGGEYDALMIPDSAVVSDQARKIVFTVDAGDIVRATPVTLGPIVDGLRAVQDGLSRNDRVVVDGLANPTVRPGAKVAPQTGPVARAAAQ
jgi:multidrug efflux system membrane fusion protein